MDCMAQLPLSYSWHTFQSELYKKIEGKCVVLDCASLLEFSHQSLAQRAIHKIKYDRRYELGYELGKYFGQKLNQTIKFQNIDYVIPLPLHPKKERSRGFNQSYWIAKGVAEAMRIELDNNLVSRVINNPPQAKLSKDKRETNVEGIFRVSFPERLANKRVLLVDDVATTGATISSLVREINSVSPTTIVSVIALSATN